ncbi:MAG: type II secretion system F family protein [Pseudomonadota bacterium]|nr:type II secretion system F family protein [Pseudomonadota bacterium]
MAAAQPALYIYKGKNKEGKPVQGEIAGSNVTVVKAQLRKQGVVTSTVKKKPKPLFKGSKPIKPADIATFTRQMATMMKAGVPLVQSFEIVSEGLENEKMRELVTQLHEDVSAGTGFGPALRKHPRHFDDLFCSLVEAGEQSGALETMLDRVATYKEKGEALKRKVKKALTYPSAVIIVAVIVTGILLVKVVPVFAQTFQSFGADLPAFTQFVMNISEFAQAWWLLIAAGLIGTGIAFKEARLRSQKFSDAVDKFALKIPIVGNIVYESVVSRFARTLSTTFAAGVPLIESLNSVAGSAGNAVFRDAIIRIRDDVSTGLQLNTAMRTTGLFPIMLIQLTSIGEESGSLDEMMEKAAVHFEESVDHQVDNLTVLLEPLIMSVLGVLVGGLLIAMYLPIFQLGQVVGG